MSKGLTNVDSYSEQGNVAKEESIKKPLYKVSQVRSPVYYIFIKRLFDIIASLLGLIIGLPLFLIIPIAIKLDTPGPVIFKQKRLGKDGKEFTIYKFRSMVHNAEAKTGAIWARKNDERVTRVGRFIRKTRMDELPQLYNILKGEMSLVGPRPERPIFTEEFERKYPGFKKRLLVRPGITGLAQVSGGYDIKPHQKLRLDLFYIEKRGILLDLKILLKTVSVVIFGRGAR